MGMTLNEFQIKINPQYAELVRPLSDKEYTELKESIKEKGLQYSIVLNPKGEILDGHHRYQICNELDIEPKYEVKIFEDLLEEQEFVIYINDKRRQLNDFSKAELAYEYEKIFKERARLRQLSKLKDVKDKLPLSPNGLNGETGQARDLAAKKAGLSKTTYERTKIIIKYGSEAVKRKLREGKMSIAYANQMVKRSQDHKAENIPELPQGQFDIILADPPWQYEIPGRGSAEDHYATMELEDICNMQVPSAEDSILFLWTTTGMLEESLKVMNYWGFKYRSHSVWVKDKIGPGYYFRGQHELLLLGKKGKIPTPEEKNRPSSVIHAPRTEHSKKPDEIYEIIERMYPNRKYLELFARRKRENWTGWGDELQQEDDDDY